MPGSEKGGCWGHRGTDIGVREGWMPGIRERADAGVREGWTESERDRWGQRGMNGVRGMDARGQRGTDTGVLSHNICA